MAQGGRRAIENAECIVAAAGRSARMGNWKPMLAFGDATIIETVVAGALAACPRVILVTGYRGRELAALFHGEPRVVAIENPDWPLGMFSSIRRGVAHLLTERFFVSLGDMPWIRPALYTALLGVAPIDAVFPVFGGRRGHPVLFSQKVKREVLSADPETGSMKDITSRLAFRELPWGDDSILRDIDTMEDYSPPSNANLPRA
jgi:molybdenum cofactor cytidylyltransferase